MPVSQVAQARGETSLVHRSVPQITLNFLIKHAVKNSSNVRHLLVCHSLPFATLCPQTATFICLATAFSQQPLLSLHSPSRTSFLVIVYSVCVCVKCSCCFRCHCLCLQKKQTLPNPSGQRVRAKGTKEGANLSRMHL